MHVWRGDNCIVQFLRFLDQKAFVLQKNSNELNRKPMSFTDVDKAEFDATQTCPRCKKEFSEQVKKVRDHCHITGKFR